MARSLSPQYLIRSTLSGRRAAFALLAFCLSTEPAHAESPATSALVISGGISLGVYEAGLNHILVESLRDPSLGLPRMASTTGASAGAINTLATALRYCEADNPDVDVLNNCFRDIWIDVGIEGLLPSQNKEYEQLTLGGVTPGDAPVVIRDAVLNRSIFQKPIQALRDKVANGHFRPDCRVHLGIMVTMGQPKFSGLRLGDGSEIVTQEQSFAIPLLLESKTRADGSTGVVFRNPVDFAGLRLNRNHILLAQAQQPGHEGEIGFDTVMRAALASSAFPLAFGKMELGYCFRSEVGEASGVCPKGYQFARDEFIDGGYFNNIPIGLAAELLALDSGRKPSDPPGSGRIEQYMFMDPDELRGRQRERPSSAAYGNLDIATQLDNILPGIGTLRKLDLYNDFDLYFTQPDQGFRQYRPTGRSPLLTGNFLSAFGAFLDPNFREYDYAAGLYDGLIYSAQMLCEREGKADDAVCEASQFLKLFNQHVSEQDLQALRPGEPASAEDHARYHKAQRLHDLRKMVAQFLYQEFKLAVQAKAWRDLAHQLYDERHYSALRVIHDAIQASGESDFERFLDALAPASESFKHQTGQDMAFSERTRYMLSRRDFWKHALAKNALQRLIFLEERDKGPHKATLSAVYIMISDDMFMPKDFGATRFPTDYYWTHLLTPDQFGLDAVQTGVSLGWTWVPRWRVPFTYLNFELGPTLHAQIGDNADSRLSYADLALGIRKSRPGIFLSSYGAAVNVNRNLSERSRFGDDYMMGVEVNAGLLADKLRLAIGTRDAIDDYVGEDWSARLMITNIDELVWAFW